MNKDYQKPEVEIIDLTAMEAITNDDTMDGEMGTSGNIFG